MRLTAMLLTLAATVLCPSVVSADIDLRVTFRGLVDLLDDRTDEEDARAFVVMPNLAQPSKLPLSDGCKLEHAHEALILFDPEDVRLAVQRPISSPCIKNVQRDRRSCTDGTSYSAYSLAGCEARFVGGGGGITTRRMPVADKPSGPANEASLNWVIDMDALSAAMDVEGETAHLRLGLLDKSPDYKGYPLLAGRVVLNVGQLTSGYVWRKDGEPRVFELPYPHSERAAAATMELEAALQTVAIVLCPLDDSSCATTAPVHLRFSPVHADGGVHVLFVNEQFGETQDKCDSQHDLNSHFNAHYVLRWESEELEDCVGPEKEEETEDEANVVMVTTNPQCSPAENQWP